MMSEDLQSAVLISAVGISVVFGVILVLWGLMTLVVRIAADRVSAEPKVPAAPDVDDQEADARQRRAAAVVAAVAASVAQERVGDTARAQAAAAAVGAYIAGESRATDSEKGV
jgi:Na+-transporting methylmalonyl-CoA/oxaloacetate decarboxylase gamma subunit